MGGSRTRLYMVRKIESTVIKRLHFIGGNATTSLLDRRSTVMLGASPFRRRNSGSLTKFAASRRASSRVSRKMD